MIDFETFLDPRPRLELVLRDCYRIEGEDYDIFETSIIDNAPRSPEDVWRVWSVN